MSEVADLLGELLEEVRGLREDMNVAIRRSQFGSDPIQMLPAMSGKVKWCRPEDGIGLVDAPGFREGIFFQLTEAGSPETSFVPGRPVEFDLWLVDGQHEARAVKAL